MTTDHRPQTRLVRLVRLVRPVRLVRRVRLVRPGWPRRRRPPGRARPGGRSLLRIGPVSLLIRRRATLVAAVLTVLLLLAVVLSLSLGTPYVAPADVLRALSGAGTPYDLVVFDLRLPRIVLAAVAGAAFGVAGTLIQSVARNPSPARTSSASPRAPASPRQWH
ncbi:iron chelate uptake ABC transporter family permease subunit [Micromonospora sp. M12]